jgi:hypothetical protein
VSKSSLAWSIAVAASIAAVVGCGNDEDANDFGTTPPSASVDGGPSSTLTPEEQVRQLLDSRKVDYGEALRIASLKLGDELPPLGDIKQIANAPSDADRKRIYESLVDARIASPKFNAIMVKFFKDTFRTGQEGKPQNGMPNKDTAANFAAQIVVEGRSWKELFTASSGTCPTFDVATGAFTKADCPAGPVAKAAVGVLTDPGLQAQYFANMAFRRARFVQETFACSKFPSEFSAKPVPMGSGTYTNPRSFEEITGKQNTPTALIDFQDTASVVCANCHGTLNAQATLFLNFDEKGILQTTPQVLVPVPKTPKATLADFMPAGKQVFAWRLGTPVVDLKGFGEAMAADPEVARCAVNRVWNYALSRGDIVNDLASIPSVVTESLAKEFSANGMVIKETLRAIFKSEDFVKF